MAKKTKLTPEEKQYIDDQVKWQEQILESFERAKQFKEGDYLIQWTADWSGKWSQQKNSYGAPTKYKVVFVSESSIPFVKSVNATGGLVGEVMCIVGEIDHGDYIDNGCKTRWELDPDYADSLLLQQEYNHAELHNAKKVLWKEVTEYNKAHKIKTDNIQSIVEFFRTLKVGNNLWTSNISNLLIRDTRLLSKADTKKIVKNIDFNRVKGPFVIVLTVVDKKGTVRDIAADYFLHKALYKERPRTYKELNL